MQIRPKYRFANTTLRDAFRYDPNTDVNQWLEVGSSAPFTLYRITAVSTAGVGTFEQVGGSAVPTAHATTHIPGGTDALATAAAGAIQPDDSAAEGSAASFARSDHRHSIAAAAPSQGIGGGNTEGASTSFARADHDHKLRETGGPTDLTIGSIPDGGVVTRSGSALVGTAISTVSVWDPDVPFASPSSYDDEFGGANGSTTGWTTFDGTTVGTATNSMDGAGHWFISQPAQSAWKPVGAYKTLSDTTFCQYVRVRFQGSLANACNVFAFLGIKTSGTWATSDAAVVLTFANAGPSSAADTVVGGSTVAYGITPLNMYEVSNFSALSGGSGRIASALGAPYRTSEAILRIRHDNSTHIVHCDIGDPITGRGWVTIGRFDATAFTVKVIGFGLTYNNGAPAAAEATVPAAEFDWFRVVTGTASPRTAVGRQITRYFG